MEQHTENLQQGCAVQQEAAGLQGGSTAGSSAECTVNILTISVPFLLPGEKRDDVSCVLNGN